ncbi:DUF3955 domain-containing protein [Kurthia gibsonii]|uniref:DUF3955 domain-containing protein n=1 Tax=Kurthia gibsonii TaxID=33946 RepID=UPI000EABA897|nr:DUF3955 domain-containing protein [Kurthia gibsonii]RXH50865.1 DUF3955 domain-containing protein [Kurthia gibsonii]
MKKYALPLLPIILAALSFLTFNLIGSRVAIDGTLQEPFFLIPIGFMFLFIGIIWTALRFIMNKNQKVNI